MALPSMDPEPERPLHWGWGLAFVIGTAALMIAVGSAIYYLSS
jgi:hypothetical protein